jgi:hypothetical protein
MLRDWKKTYMRIRGLYASSEYDIAQARMLAATPEERWDLHQEFLRSVGWKGYWENQKAGFGDTLEEQKATFERLNLQPKFISYLAAPHRVRTFLRKHGSKQPVPRRSRK